MKPVALPCPYCGNVLQLGLWDFVLNRGMASINHWQGNEVYCPSCKHHSTFPTRIRVAGTLAALLAVAMAFLVVEWTVGIRQLGAWSLITLMVVTMALWAFIQALVVRWFRTLIAVRNPT